ncbi:FixH family protein [uncultured Streptomyces sp.]|uniref:FixH family protein n=1 Tax=uncultured Streptomyces sp. TaxID=174707 RepID=UPI002606CDE8|nr:FixH family protein [uncultured Streptomyces sp.]
MTWRTATTQPAVRGTNAARRAGPRTPEGAVRLAAVTSAALAAALVTGCSTTTPASAGTSGGTDLDASCRATKSDNGLEITFAVSPCPAKGGGAAGTATITVKDAAGKAVEGAKVEINPEMPNMKMKGGNQSARAKGDGYEAKLVLGMPGDWHLTVVVTPASGKASTTAFNVKAE